jgi:acyl-CoA reductase-like NAD-dependent aldehyde dehydrogenase
MKMFLRGQWVAKPAVIEVTHPYDGSVVDTVPAGDAGDVETALAVAVEGAATMRRMPAHERSRILARAAELMHERLDDLGRTISREVGKTFAEGKGEASRAVETMRLSAEEAKRISGEVLPLDAAPGGADKLGFTLRVPCGIVVAITPFNFPLNLVCHKVGPALAAGNAVVVKPASDTPLSSLRLVEILLEAGLPPLAIACLTGPGGTLGDALVRDRRVRKVSFTGSRDVGEKLCHAAGLKRVTLELGSNSPLIVMPDANLDRMAELAVLTGYSNAGQTCISTQRVIALDEVYGDTIEALRPRVEAWKAGDPFDPEVKMGPMIRERDAGRVGDWIREAVSAGARLVVGGERSGALFQPTLVADVEPTMRISCDELFGPAVAVTRAATLEQAIAMANDSHYGLSAGIFTQDIDSAMRFAREVESGNIHINWGPAWRADLMPYGGVKESGFGKEGPKYAVEQMTEVKMVVVHLRQP